MKSDLLISLKKYPEYTQLIRQLVDLGYTRVPLVYEPGDFAVRGSLIDVFPVNQSHPLRVEYDPDGKLERLDSFNVSTQRGISTLDKTRITPVDAQSEVMVHWAAPEGISDQVLSDINVGDYVVHETYGVGRFEGLVRLVLDRREGEFLFVKYRGEDKLYVPLEQLQLIHRYSGADDTPALSGLHDGLWQRTKSRIKKELALLADDLVLLYQKRLTVLGFACGEDTPAQSEFESAFEYQATPDQIRSTAEIKKDMQQTRPMDRVLCGDVGYGKTEVMARAAFKACDHLKQIAVLAPTTLLAIQHARVFEKRFAPFHVRVAVLSRFTPKSEQKKILKDIQDHKVDIVIGTHRLLQKDVQFKDLGLLIVDEEQRFGVTHKEKIKQLFPAVHVLSVSATPIPRTLYMALTGAREFSAIETPPVLKQSVVTHVLPYDEKRMIRAIQAELDRGGQVYYLYNHVQQMSQRLAVLKRLLPQCRFAIAHGQLPEHQLETTMLSFMDGKIDVLLCSTIIENGIDCHRVNTIIIEDANHYGLSQIHQLRGRVGRGAVQGIAYLFYPHVDTLSDIAIRRLQAIKEYAALGSGYKLALRDLEIRGAGTLLGKRQHGHMTSVGFELYCKLLTEAMSKKSTTKGQKTTISASGIPQGFYLPDHYISEPRQRLAVYQRLGALRYRYELEDLQADLQDRYGRLPDFVRTIFAIMWDALV